MPVVETVRELRRVWPIQQRDGTTVRLGVESAIVTTRTLMLYALVESTAPVASTDFLVGIYEEPLANATLGPFEVRIDGRCPVVRFSNSVTAGLHVLELPVGGSGPREVTVLDENVVVARRTFVGPGVGAARVGEAHFMRVVADSDLLPPSQLDLWRLWQEGLPGNWPLPRTRVGP